MREGGWSEGGWGVELLGSDMGPDSGGRMGEEVAIATVMSDWGAVAPVAECGAGCGVLSSGRPGPPQPVLARVWPRALARLAPAALALAPQL